MFTPTKFLKDIKQELCCHVAKASGDIILECSKCMWYICQPCFVQLGPFVAKQLITGVCPSCRENFCGTPIYPS